MNRNRIPALTLALALLTIPILAAAQNPAVQPPAAQNPAVQPPAAQKPPAQNPAAQPAPAPVPAPDTKFLTLEGKTAALSDYKGKVILLDFWATWCGPCRMAMPGLQKMYDSMKSKGLVVLGVSLDKNPPVQVPPFLKKMGISYTNLANNPKDPCSLKWDVRAIPSLYLIDRKGNVVRWWRGLVPESLLLPAVEEALAGKK